MEKHRSYSYFHSENVKSSFWLLASLSRALYAPAPRLTAAASWRQLHPVRQ